MKDLFNQIIDEARPNVFLTVGTAGGVFAEQDLGDVVVTRAAKFRLQDEFKNEPFNGKTYVCDWKIPTSRFGDATNLMATFKDNLQEPPEFLPPTASFTKPVGGFPKPVRPYNPNIWLDGQVVNHHKTMPKFHPILTTDYFEYGTSVNHLEERAVRWRWETLYWALPSKRGRLSGKHTPNWAVVRNCSDPQINGLLKDQPKKESLQVLWAVYYYSSFGYWTSIMSALTTWAIVAGLE